MTLICRAFAKRFCLRACCGWKLLLPRCIRCADDSATSSCLSFLLVRILPFVPRPAPLFFIISSLEFKNRQQCGMILSISNTAFCTMTLVWLFTAVKRKKHYRGGYLVRENSTVMNLVLYYSTNAVRFQASVSYTFDTFDSPLPL